MGLGFFPIGRSSVCLWAVLFAAASGWCADGPQKVRIAYASLSSSALPQYMALQRGYFKEQGLDVEIIQMNPRLGAVVVWRSYRSRRRTRSFATFFRDNEARIHSPKRALVAFSSRDPERAAREQTSAWRRSKRITVAEEMQAKGSIPIRFGLAIGDGLVRAGTDQRRGGSDTSRRPRSHAEKKWVIALAGPPEIGLP